MASILPSTGACCDPTPCNQNVIYLVPGPAGPEGPPGDVGGGGGSAASIGWFIVDSLALARLIAADPTNSWLDMLGGTTKGDGFGASFYWDNLSNDLDDYTPFGGSTINPDGNAGSGRWKRF